MSHAQTVASRWPQQAFVISGELIDAVSAEEIEATFADMQEAGIAGNPFDAFDIIVPQSRVITLVDKDGNDKGRPEDEPWMSLRARFGGARPTWIWTSGKRSVDIENYEREIGMPLSMRPQRWEEAAEACRKMLIVLLATRNIVKERRECKLLKYGIGSKLRNRYTTTIKVGKVTEHAEGSSNQGHGVRPHLRRGHIRRQHHGPNRELVKSIFIQPVFVNADQGWIADRTAYNVSGAA